MTAMGTQMALMRPICRRMWLIRPAKTLSTRHSWPSSRHCGRTILEPCHPLHQWLMYAHAFHLSTNQMGVCPGSLLAALLTAGPQLSHKLVAVCASCALSRLHAGDRLACWTACVRLHPIQFSAPACALLVLWQHFLIFWCISFAQGLSGCTTQDLSKLVSFGQSFMACSTQMHPELLQRPVHHVAQCLLQMPRLPPEFWAFVVIVAVHNANSTRGTSNKHCDTAVWLE